MSRQSRGEYNPLKLRFALRACRFANAEWNSRGNRGMRYIVDAPIHEAIDRDCEVLVLDIVEDVLISVPDLMLRLTPENAAVVSWTHSPANGQAIL